METLKNVTVTDLLKGTQIITFLAGIVALILNIGQMSENSFNKSQALLHGDKFIPNTDATNGVVLLTCIILFCVAFILDNEEAK